MCKRFVVLFLLFVFAAPYAYSQSQFVKLGMRYMISADFSNAIIQFEKADKKEPNNISTLRLLAYSYYQSQNYVRAIDVYSRIINLKNTEADAYYYRGKARLFIANDPKESASPARADYYNGAIADFTSSLSLLGDSDIKSLQNRGIAYKDQAIFYSYQHRTRAAKGSIVALFQKSLKDFGRLLQLQPGRKDISAQAEYVRRQIASLQ